MLARFFAATTSLALVAAGCKPTLNYSVPGNPDGGGGNIGIDAGVSILEHHNHPSRDGVYVDAALGTLTGVVGSEFMVTMNTQLLEHNASVAL